MPFAPDFLKTGSWEMDEDAVQKTMTTREFQSFALKQLSKIDDITQRVEELSTRLAVLDTVVKMIDYKGVDDRLSKVEKEHEATEARIKLAASLVLTMLTFASALAAALLARCYR